MGIPTLISTSTVTSGTSSIDITSGIDSTYDEYMFVMTNVHGATDNTHFGFQFNVDGGADFNETITSTWFEATHDEAAGSAEVAYGPSYDQAQGSAFQQIGVGIGADADQNFNGILHLFSPSNTTYVKHFYARASYDWHTSGAKSPFVAGHINTTTAIDEISFKFASGNIDAAVIQMYGIA